MGNQCCSAKPEVNSEIKAFESEAMFDIKSVRAELETPSTIDSPREVNETKGGLMSQPDDKALQERMALMDQIEANPEENDQFVRIVEPSSFRDGEAEAMADIKQARVDAQAELAF